MPTPQELQDQFWEALAADRTMMLGLDGVKDGHARPMTALVDEAKSPIWFFTATDTDLVEKLPQGKRAVATFASKGHDLFATLHGSLHVDNDPAMIEKLWNPYVAAWFEGGKTDPKLALLRFDAERAEIWQDASSVVSGVKMLLGADPKQEYRDQQAKVALR